jgi:hypothetical protein
VGRDARQEDEIGGVIEVDGVVAGGGDDEGPFW